MVKEMTTEELDKDIQALLKYVDTLEKDNHLLRSDLTERQKSRETLEKHSQQVLAEIQKQTSIFAKLVDVVRDLRPKGSFG